MLPGKVRGYIEKHGIDALNSRTCIDKKVLESIAENRGERHRHYVINCLYDFFDLSKKDNYYKAHLISWQNKTDSIYGSYFRIKRIEAGKSVEELGKECNIGPRALNRLEAGDTLPSINSYTIQTLFERLEFSEEEKHKIKILLQVSYELKKDIVEKYNTDRISLDIQNALPRDTDEDVKSEQMTLKI